MSESRENLRQDVDAALMTLADRVGDIEVKLINLANKLDEHMKKPDAHNPAILYKEK